MGGDRVAIMVAPVIFLVVVVAAMQSAEATTYKVGDDQGWKVPSNSSFYSTWASGKVFYVNDVLEFVFNAPSHTVALASKVDYDACATNIIPSYASSANVTLNTAGDWYFLCTVGTHCKSGQKLAITVTAGTGSTPQTPPPPPPPKSNSAAPTSVAIAAATSVIFALVYVVGLLH